MAGAIPRNRSHRVFEREQRPRRFDGLETKRFRHPGGPTLESRISRTWSMLVETGTSDCPVCSARAQAACPCESCGSELS